MLPLRNPDIPALTYVVSVASIEAVAKDHTPEQAFPLQHRNTILSLLCERGIWYVLLASSTPK